MDPEHRLVVAVVPGARTVENTEALVEDFRRRTGGRLMNLMTSDDYPAYETAILHAYGETVTPPRTGKPGRPKAPYQAPPAGLNYAMVTKRREKGRVVEVGTRVVFGTVAAVLLALGMSKVSRAINTAFVERQNGTDRHRNARKAPQDVPLLEGLAVSRGGHLLEPVQLQLLLAGADAGRSRMTRAAGSRRSPAMAAGLTDHVWSMSEWLSLPAVQHC